MTEAWRALARELRYTDVSACNRVWDGHVSARHVVQRLVARSAATNEATTSGRAFHSRDPAGAQSGPQTTSALRCLGTRCEDEAAKCCHAGTRRQHLGIVPAAGGVSVHRTDCTNAGRCNNSPSGSSMCRGPPSPSAVFLVASRSRALRTAQVLSD